MPTPPFGYEMIREPVSFYDGHYLFKDDKGQLLICDHSINEDTLDPASTEDGLLYINTDITPNEPNHGEFSYSVQVMRSNSKGRVTVGYDTHRAIQNEIYG